MNISKKTAFGATAAAAALIVVGISAPAMADDRSDWNGSKGWQQISYSERSSSESTTVVAPQVDVLGGDILTGDILGGEALTGDIANDLVGDIGNGNAVASGNEVNAPIVSGNETAVGNGNDTAIGNVSDVADVSDIGNVSDTSVGTEVSDLVDSVVGTEVSDIVDVDEILGDVGGWVDLNGMFED